MLRNDLPPLLVLSTTDDQRFIQAGRALTHTLVMTQLDDAFNHLSVSSPCVVAADIERIASLTAHPKAVQCVFMALWNPATYDLDNPWPKGLHFLVELHGQESLLGHQLEGALELLSRLQDAQMGRQQAQVHLESFIHTVNHDLRGPLQGILGLAGLLLEREGDLLSPESRNYLTRIEDDAQRIAEMVQSLARYGRLGAQGLELSSFPLKDAVLTAFDHAATSQTGRNPKILIDGELPTVNADRDLLEQSLEALMQNAIIYNQGPTPMVTVIWKQPEDDGANGRLEIHDDGIGIPEGQHADAFELFRRLERHQGTGLGVGLAFVKRIAELHQQDASLAASIHGGTVVRLGFDTVEG